MSVAELSLCLNPDQQSTYLLELLRSSAFQSLAELQVNIHSMLWENYKREITAMALSNRGSDVSQVGFLLTDDLIAMNVLMPLLPQLLVKIGGEAHVPPHHLENSQTSPGRAPLGLPWLFDPRALFYWKDLLEDAKINAETAFQTAESMEDACQRMQASGVEAPWVLGTADKFVIIHSIVSWVWGKGGDFISPEGDPGCHFRAGCPGRLGSQFPFGPL